MADPSVHIFFGAYGSGKTEVAINFARRENQSGKSVCLIDLDIVNPYFRARDVRAGLAAQGIRVVSSASGLEQADLPALSPGIMGALQTPGLTVILDVGGDPTGARALARFHGLLTPLVPDVWAVVNPYRPGTRTSAEVAEMVRALEAWSRQRATGLVANPNLGAETTAGTIAEGRGLVQAAADALGLPVVLTCVRADLAALAAERDGLFLPLDRYMLLPWEKGDDR